MKKSVFIALSALLLISPACSSAKDGRDLFEAAGRGDLKTLRANESRLKEKNAEGESLLIRAASEGRIETVEWLLRRGVSVNETDREGGTALFYAISSGEETVALQLIESGADLEKNYGKLGESVLFEAVRSGRNRVIRKILSLKPELVRRKNLDGETPLFEAVRSAQSESAKILLEKGAEKDARNKKGRRAVDLADPKTDSALIRLLK